MKLTADEATQVSSLLADLQTYVETTTMLWMTGQNELDDSSWNEFVLKCESMNLEEILDVYTAAYHRYVEK